MSSSDVIAVEPLTAIRVPNPISTIRVPNPISADAIVKGLRNLRYLRNPDKYKSPDEVPDDAVPEEDRSYPILVGQGFRRNHKNKDSIEMGWPTNKALIDVTKEVPFHVFMTNSALMFVEEQCAFVAEKYPGEFTTTRQVFNLTFDDWIARVRAPNERAWYETLAEQANAVVLAHQKTTRDKKPP
jgi:hypothetical protein